MAEEEKDKTEEKKENYRASFTGVLEILASKVSRKGTIVAMAMVLIYLLVALLAATPNVSELLIFSGVIAGFIVGLAIFFTTLQWILDVKDDRKDKRKRGIHRDSLKEET